MKPRVVFASSSMGVGGAERWMLTLARHMERVQVSGFLITGNVYDSNIVAEAREIGVPFFLPSERFDCDAVVTWGISDIRRMIGPISFPVVEVSHCCADLGTGLMELSAKQATHLTAVSEAAKGAYPASLRDMVTVIENGAELERVKVDKGGKHYKSMWGTGPKNKVVAVVGRLAKEKCPQRLFEVANHLPYGWTAVLVGNQGSASEDCYELAVECNRRAVIMPAVPNVGDIYDAIDVMFIPSRSEGHSLVMLEAWLAGVPVVTAPFDSAIEMQTRWGDVLTIVDPGASDRKIAKAIRKAAKRDTRHAKAVARKYYTGEAMATRWEDYLIDICST